MDNSVIPTLEAAAEMLMAPPNLVTSEQRYQAESVFLEFRNSKNPYQLCREILEKSSYDYVLFETASLLKTALIREWNLLTEDDITSLREYLVNYLFGKEIPPFLKDKLLQTLAVIIKRGSISDSGRDRKALLDELEKIIISSPIGQQKLACSMIQAIMEEYAITVKSTDVGITWEVHYGLKKSFEATDLKRIFRFTVSVLEQIVRSGVRPEGDQAVLTKQLLNIVETILCWFHVSPLMSKRLIGDFESLYQSDGAPALRLNLRWKDTILKPELIALFFEIHVHVRMDPELATPSLICLVQLACLSGVILSGNNLKEQYYNNYVNNFIRMMSVIQPFPREMLGISNIYCKLVQFFTLPMIAASPPEFLQYLTTYTCHCIRGSIIEEGINDDTLWREALNKFIHTWSSLTPETNEPIVNVNVACIEIFNTYLQCRLAPPDGTRGVESSDGCNEDIKDDSQEDERQLHSNVLMTIGAIARKAPAHCFHVLFTLLNDRSKRLESQLQLMHMGKLSVDGGQQLITLFEDLHWILMITGHFIAYDCSEGDRATMPLELVQYSISENASVDASLRYFVGESSSTDNVDSILKIMGVIFRISLYEYAALEAGLGSGFSPELSATISWLLKIWASAYLMQQSPQHSEVLERAFGTGTQGSLWSISRITRRAAAVLRHLSSQPVAATHATQLLAILAHNQRKESPIASCEEFVSLVAWEAAGNNLPGHVRRELHRVFAIAASYSEGEVRARLLTSTVALNEKLQNILNMDSDTEPVRNMLADTIDCFIGVTDGVHEVGCVDEQFMMLLCALDKVPAIVFKYHNYQGVVSPAINLLLRSAKRLLHSVQLQNVNKFLEVCNTTFEVYRRWNSGKISSIPQDAEEEAYEDICAIMELVGAIARSGDTEVEPTTARGLRLVLPLVTPALLSMPTLALHAYRMLRDLEHHDQFTKLPVEDFAMVISALRVGLTAVSCDVSSPCCETITGIANKVRTLGADNPYAVSLLSLAELLLMLIIKMEIPPDTIPTAGMAIYALTCVKPALLEGLARQLIDAFAVNDPANVPRLEEAFAVLTNGVLFDGLRTHKLRFQSNFDKFLTSVRGFLIVK